MNDAPDCDPPAAPALVAPPRNGACQRIAFFMYRMSGGGAWRSAVKLANGLVDRGYAVDVVVVNERSPYAESLSPDIRLVVLNQPQWGKLHTALYRYLPFRRIKRVFLSALPLTHYLQVRQPDILVSCGNRVHLTAAIAWRSSGKRMPLILRATNLLSGNLNLWAPLRLTLDLSLRGLSRFVCRPGTHTVAVSDGVAEEVVRLANRPREAINTVFEPVIDDAVAEKANAPLVHPWFEPGQPPVLLAVGKLRSQKDYPTLIRAFAQVRNRRPVRLVILGSGSVPGLQDLIAAHGVESDVCLFGYAENPYAWMARASMFVLSSAWEGLGCVLIEALACGCPVVSTNCPSGPSEILDKGKYGRLVPCRDPAALAEAIFATLDEPVDRQALRDRARVFDLESSIEGYIATFEHALASHQPRGSVFAKQ